MKKKPLKNKPLVEAIFELQWELIKVQDDMIIDPYYSILLASLPNKFREEYQFHEPLTTANIPDEMSAYFVKHRFRKAKDKWPLFQIGPGIITINDTENYDWEDFSKRINSIIDALFEFVPDSANKLHFKSLELWFINDVEFDYEKNDIFKFLDEKMKLNIKIDNNLLRMTDVNELPLGFDLRFTLIPNKLKGAIKHRFIRIKKDNEDKLRWETHIHAVGKDVPGNIGEIKTWIDNAHKLAENWFYEMTKGELLRSFE